MTVRYKTIDRKDTSVNFTQYNPVLSSGTIGHETDTGKIKIGDGTTAWNLLQYANVSGMPYDVYLEASDEHTGADGLLYNRDSVAIESTVDSTKIRFYLDSTTTPKKVKIQTLVGTTWTDSGIEWELA